VKWQLLLFVLLLSSTVSGAELIFSSNQTEYYFPLGSSATVVIDIDNQYEKELNGQVTYTIRQEVNQGGFKSSQTQMQSNSMSIAADQKELGLQLGSSDAPMDLVLETFNFKFTDPDGKIMETTLEGITVHFVQDPSQQQESESKQSSQESTGEQEPPPAQSQPNPQTEQKLQNNQQGQDMNSLKNQLNQEMAKREELKKEFAQEIGKNEEVAKAHQEMVEQGFKPTESELNPGENNNSGEFSMDYENENGEKQSIQGEMENGELTEFENGLDRRKLEENIANDPDFKKYDNDLKQKGFTPNNVSVNGESGSVNYLNNKTQEQAKIPFDIVNKTEPIIHKPEIGEKGFPWWIFGVIMAVIIGYLFLKKKKEEIIENVIEEVPVDYHKEAQGYLDKAKKLFDDKKYKDAYGMASYAIRYFYSYKFDLKKELTAFETVKLLKGKKEKWESASECLNLCSLVEFAKYSANRKHFDKIVKLAERIIG